ncbi:hypothetical protein GMLC_04970 [Geomonas limicola]|uniref:SD-repeat containing protein B domain-containing protein n=1 Tax=Geomonas limicola TaxID=2740186 RepID=A0A6V8N304_9BACT|nr:SdrD B-like domain-containing protein [Geomonas limicola]GFO66918.1 hypothetical protein GMLC_04970 [Geomonas limicola]
MIRLRFLFVCLVLLLTAQPAWCDILGVTPGYPNTTFSSVTGTSFSPTSGLLSVATTPQLTTLSSGTTAVRVGTPRSLTIAVQVDSSGRLVGGVNGDDLVLIGTVGSYTGTLLTGEIIEYGITNSGAIDYLDFRFRVTGGALAGLYAGQDIGVTQSIENSSFNGSFLAAFAGGAKGNLGPIPQKPVCNGAIGDFVWNDQNRDGIQDAGEPGLDNVRLTLQDATGNQLASTLSGPNGAYLFSGLCAGSYTVSVDATTLPAGFVPSPAYQGGDTTRDSNPTGTQVTLPTGSTVERSIDFGYNSPCTGSLGDLVWHDQNRSGIQDPGEPGINGVTVNLYNPASGALIGATTTNGTGNYLFTGLCAGSYRVEALPPAGFVASPSLKGSDRAADSNPNPAEITLPSDFTSEPTVDFGFNTPCTGSIGDFVWQDLNRNGIQEPGEPGINGVRVLLKDSFSNLIASASTTGNGFYQFTGLCAGSYRVEVDATTLPAGLVASPVQAGGDRGADSNPSPAPVVLDSDASSDATVDFGFNTPCSGYIGDLVWLDANRDGIQNPGETGINGVTVLLKDAANTTSATATTGTGPLGQAGYYGFSGLCAGSYTVEVITPANLVPSPSLAGADVSVDSNGSPAALYLPADDSVEPTIDFGFNPPCSGSIGNLVWDDANRNGIQDAGEAGIDGVTVNLRDASNVLISSTTTAGGGLYQFAGLCAGSYQVEVIPPAGRAASPVLAGNDRALDSNPNPAPVLLAGDSSSDQSIDFGFNTPCTGTIGDLIWHDTNRDGIQGGAEPGIAGAQLVLKNDQGTVIATTSSNASGAYRFAGLCRGSYTVEVATPAGFVPSPSLAGNDRALDSNPVPAPVVLADDASQDLGIDFGFNTPCTGVIGDFVWNDLNADGIQDAGEPGLAGVTVNLRDGLNTLLRTTQTLADGSYRFIGVCAGDYRVEVVPPAGLTPAPVQAGSNPALDSNPNPAAVSLFEDSASDLSIDFGYFRALPGLSVKASCQSAPAPGLPISVTALVTNTGNETLTGLGCSDSQGSQLSGMPTSLAPGLSFTLTGSYLPAGSGSLDTVTCSATGALDQAGVSASSSASCGILTAPALTVTASCASAPVPGLPVTVSAVLTNAGNETLAGFSCTDSQGASLSGIPTLLLPGASATVTGSYLPASATSSETISCSARGTINGVTVSADSSTSCGTDGTVCIKVKKQVSTTCTVTGGKDKHCRSDEGKEEHCKRHDTDHGYCRDSAATKASYCHEVSRKQAHCQAYETKASHCAKSDCDKSYCERPDLDKDDYCKIPAVPVCVPVWLDADTQDTGAPVLPVLKGELANGDDLLAKISSGSLADSIPGWLAKILQALSRDDSDQAEVKESTESEATVSLTCDSSEYYQGHQRQSGLAFRFIVENCGTSDLTQVSLDDPRLGIAGYQVGALAAGESITIGADAIPKLAQPDFTCTSSFVNTVTATGTDLFGHSASASDDAFVICNTKSCTFTQGYWKNHPAHWPVTSLKLGNTSYTQSQLIAIFETPNAGNGLISLAQQLSAAKLNVANGTRLPSGVQQAITSADQLIGALVVPPVGSGSLSSAQTAALTQTLESYNSGSYPGGPSHCGEAPPPSCSGVIGDFVWNDLNKNGSYQAGEPGLAGVKVTLSNGKSTTSDATGHYQFTGLCPGSYQVKVVPPCGYQPTSPGTVSVTLTASAASNLSADFGLARPGVSCSGKIGDFIWKDLNKNGIQDWGEPGLAGVTVSLGNGASTTSDANGYYQFTGLCAGEYQVSVATPTGYTPSPAGQGTNSARDSKLSPTKVTLSSNASSVQNLDYGFFKSTAPECTGVIGNYVWNDANKNGLQDCTEKGIAGVVLRLSTGQSAVTDAEGHYQFTGLCAGSYTVSVLTPDGFTPSPTLQGGSRASDSNPTPATVTLGDNRGSDLGIDFGFWKLPKPGQGEGCSLGYWKTHSASWPAAHHGYDSFDGTFGVSAFSPDLTLLQAVNLGGGGLNNLARQAAAALLNAEDGRIKGFPLSVSELKGALAAALASGSYDALAATLDAYNNLCCPLK